MAPRKRQPEIPPPSVELEDGTVVRLDDPDSPPAPDWEWHAGWGRWAPPDYKGEPSVPAGESYLEGVKRRSAWWREPLQDIVGPIVGPVAGPVARAHLDASVHVGPIPIPLATLSPAAAVVSFLGVRSTKRAIPFRAYLSKAPRSQAELDQRQPAPPGGGNGGGPAYGTPAPSATPTGPSLPPPIGVAPDYVAAVRPTGNILPTQGVPGGPGAGQVMPTPPRYLDGDEWTVLADLSPETVARLQEQLQEMGYLSPTATLNYGTVDGPTAGAMREILAVANVQGSDWATAFRSATRNAPGYLTEHRQEQAAEEAARAEAERQAKMPTPLGPAPLSNPDELRAVVQQVARRTMGMKADEGFVNAFTAQFQAAESARWSNQAWDPDSRQWIPRDATAPTPPDLAAEKAILGNPELADEAGAYALLNTLDAFEQIITRPGA